MKSLLLVGVCLFTSISACLGQFGDDLNCSPGVYPNNAPNNIVRSTVTYNINPNGFGTVPVFGCTGTLLNQNVDGRLRQLLLTSRHCIHEGDVGGGPRLPLGSFEFVFNFQSPNGDNNRIPQNIPSLLGNRGPIAGMQHRYIFQSAVRPIYESDAIVSGFGVDIALLEILTPIPPHFNPHFAGWKSDGLLGELGALDAPMRMVHHPSGDAKKVSTTYAVVRYENVVAQGCRTVTKVIDFIISFFRIFGGRVVTETICNYVDVPQFTVSAFTSGAARDGSSGSAIFSNTGRAFGVYSVNLGNLDCVPLYNSFGKFRNAYANYAMRDALNPSYVASQNLIGGMGGQEYGCRNDNPLRLSGHYFPARDYQPENTIVLRATESIEAGAVDSDGNGVASRATRINAAGGIEGFTGNGIEEGLLRIYTGADFVFTAGRAITLLPGFSVDAGATFTARIEGCAALQQTSVPPLQTISSVSAPLPPAETLPADETELLTVQPNPTTGPVQGRYRVRQPGPVSVQVVAADGRVVRSVVSLPAQQPGLYYFGTDLAELPIGVYVLQLQTQTDKAAGRVVLAR